MEKIILTTADELRLIVKEAVLDSQSPQKEQKPELDTINLPEALVFLTENGYPTSKGKMYKLTSEGKIPHRVYNNKLVFSRKELLSWAESQTKQKNNHSEIISTIAKSARRKIR